MIFPIYHKLGGEKIALAIIAKADGKPPSRDALKQWRKLGRIPAIRATHLLDACTRRGITAIYDEDCVTPSKGDVE